jgi:site-specific recombinase XerD
MFTVRLLLLQKNIINWLKKLANEVGIEKKVTCHIARHSFGNISGDKIPVQMLQKLYRHSDITTTINYQQSFINKDTDDALALVIGDD